MSVTAGVAGRARPLPATARVLLVGDVRLYRELLAGALLDEDGVEVVGSASCDVAAIEAGMHAPDVVLVDVASVSLPDGMHALAAALPDAKLIGVGVRRQQVRHPQAVARDGVEQRPKRRARVDEDRRPARLVADHVGVREPARVHAPFDNHGSYIDISRSKLRRWRPNR